MDHIKLISEQIDKVRPYLLKAGLKLGKIIFDGKKISEASQEEIEHAYKWITGFYEGFCVGKIDKARALIPESQWKHYELMNLKETWEQNELATAYRITKEAWINRPNVLVTRKQENDRKRKNKNSRGSNKANSKIFHRYDYGGQLHSQKIRN